MTESLSELARQVNSEQDANAAAAATRVLDDQNRSILNKAVHETVGRLFGDLSIRPDVERYTGEFIKAVPLFMPGGKGKALSALAYSLDGTSYDDAVALDGKAAGELGIGAIKGFGTKTAFDFVGGKDLKLGMADAPVKGILMGTSARGIDAAATPDNWFNNQGGLDIKQGFGRVFEPTFSKEALAVDAASFTFASLGVLGTSRIMKSVGSDLSKSPLGTSLATGASFGLGTGMYTEYDRQKKNHEAFDADKIIMRGVLESGTMMASAGTGHGITAKLGETQVFRTPEQFAAERLQLTEAKANGDLAPGKLDLIKSSLSDAGVRLAGAGGRIIESARGTKDAAASLFARSMGAGQEFVPEAAVSQALQDAIDRHMARKTAAQSGTAGDAQAQAPAPAVVATPEVTNAKTKPTTVADVIAEIKAPAPAAQPPVQPVEQTQPAAKAKRTSLDDLIPEAPDFLDVPPLATAAAAKIETGEKGAPVSAPEVVVEPAAKPRSEDVVEPDTSARPEIIVEPDATAKPAITLDAAATAGDTTTPPAEFRTGDAMWKGQPVKVVEYSGQNPADGKHFVSIEVPEKDGTSSVKRGGIDFSEIEYPERTAPASADVHVRDGNEVAFAKAAELLNNAVAAPGTAAEKAFIDFAKGDGAAVYGELAQVAEKSQDATAKALVEKAYPEAHKAVSLLDQAAKAGLGTPEAVEFLQFAANNPSVAREVAFHADNDGGKTAKTLQRLAFTPEPPAFTVPVGKGIAAEEGFQILHQLGTGANADGSLRNEDLVALARFATSSDGAQLGKTMLEGGDFISKLYDNGNLVDAIKHAYEDAPVTVPQGLEKAADQGKQLVLKVAENPSQENIVELQQFILGAGKDLGEVMKDTAQTVTKITGDPYHFERVWKAYDEKIELGGTVPPELFPAYVDGYRWLDLVMQSDGHKGLPELAEWAKGPGKNLEPDMRALTSELAYKYNVRQDVAHNMITEMVYHPDDIAIKDAKDQPLLYVRPESFARVNDLVETAKGLGDPAKAENAREALVQKLAADNQALTELKKEAAAAPDEQSRRAKEEELQQKRDVVLYERNKVLEFAEEGMHDLRSLRLQAIEAKKDANEDKLKQIQEDIKVREGNEVILAAVRDAIADKPGTARNFASADMNRFVNYIESKEMVPPTEVVHVKQNIIDFVNSNPQLQDQIKELAKTIRSSVAAEAIDEAFKIDNVNNFIAHLANYPDANDAAKNVINNLTQKLDTMDAQAVNRTLQSVDPTWPNTYLDSFPKSDGRFSKPDNVNLGDREMTAARVALVDVKEATLDQLKTMRDSGGLLGMKAAKEELNRVDKMDNERFSDFLRWMVADRADGKGGTNADALAFSGRAILGRDDVRASLSGESPDPVFTAADLKQYLAMPKSSQVGMPEWLANHFDLNADDANVLPNWLRGDILRRFVLNADQPGNQAISLQVPAAMRDYVVADAAAQKEFALAREKEKSKGDNKGRPFQYREPEAIKPEIMDPTDPKAAARRWDRLQALMAADMPEVAQKMMELGQQDSRMMADIVNRLGTWSYEAPKKSGETYPLHKLMQLTLPQAHDVYTVATMMRSLEDAASQGFRDGKPTEMPQLASRAQSAANLAIAASEQLMPENAKDQKTVRDIINGIVTGAIPIPEVPRPMRGKPGAPPPEPQKPFGKRSNEPWYIKPEAAQAPAPADQSPAPGANGATAADADLAKPAAGNGQPSALEKPSLGKKAGTADGEAEAAAKPAAPSEPAALEAAEPVEQPRDVAELSAAELQAEADRLNAIQGKDFTEADQKRMLEVERALSDHADAARLETERVEAERVEAERLEAERVEALRVEEAARVEAARVETARVEAARVETARVEAARVEAARVETARVEAERVANAAAQPPAPEHTEPVVDTKIAAGTEVQQTSPAAGVETTEQLSKPAAPHIDATEPQQQVPVQGVEAVEPERQAPPAQVEATVPPAAQALETAQPEQPAAKPATDAKIDSTGLEKDAAVEPAAVEEIPAYVQQVRANQPFRVLEYVRDNSALAMRDLKNAVTQTFALEPAQAGATLDQLVADGKITTVKDKLVITDAGKEALAQHDAQRQLPVLNENQITILKAIEAKDMNARALESRFNSSIPKADQIASVQVLAAEGLLARGSNGKWSLTELATENLEKLVSGKSSGPATESRPENISGPEVPLATETVTVPEATAKIETAVVADQVEQPPVDLAKVAAVEAQHAEPTEAERLRIGGRDFVGPADLIDSMRLSFGMFGVSPEKLNDMINEHDAREGDKTQVSKNLQALEDGAKENPEATEPNLDTHAKPVPAAAPEALAPAEVVAEEAPNAAAVDAVPEAAPKPAVAEVVTADALKAAGTDGLTEDGAHGKIDIEAVVREINEELTRMLNEGEPYEEAAKPASVSKLAKVLENDQPAWSVMRDLKAGRAPVADTFRQASAAHFEGNQEQADAKLNFLKENGLIEEVGSRMVLSDKGRSMLARHENPPVPHVDTPIEKRSKAILKAMDETDWTTVSILSRGDHPVTAEELADQLTNAITFGAPSEVPGEDVVVRHTKPTAEPQFGKFTTEEATQILEGLEKKGFARRAGEDWFVTSRNPINEKVELLQNLKDLGFTRHADGRPNAWALSRAEVNKSPEAAATNATLKQMKQKGILKEEGPNWVITPSVQEQIKDVIGKALQPSGVELQEIQTAQVKREQDKVNREQRGGE